VKHQKSVARAAFWMVLADAGFVAMLLGIKQLSNDMTVAEVVFWRSLVASTAVIPSLVSRRQRQTLVTRRLRYFVTRAFIVYGANLGYFYAVTAMVLADAVSLQFVIPLFTLIGAAVFLHEKVGPRRWIATAAGFAGALVIVRPGFAEIGWPVISVLVSSALYAQNWLMVKSLTATDSARAIVFYMNVLIAPLALIGAIGFGWTWPSWSLAPLIVATGLCGWAAQICQARGFASADASVVAPFDFLRLPMTAIAAYFLFGEQAEIWTWIGAAIIFTAATYITRREAKLESRLRRDDDADHPLVAVQRDQVQR
jgi:drug/metabolite transporter (DMT)-like permease